VTGSESIIAYPISNAILRVAVFAKFCLLEDMTIFFIFNFHIGEFVQVVRTSYD